MTALAEARAREVLREYCIECPAELDVEAIANAEGLIVENGDMANCMGRSNFGDRCGIIRLSKDITTVGQRRFTIAHEMGHYYNDKKRESFCTAEDLMGAKSNKVDEDNANAFAVELLMKREWYEAFVKEKDPGIYALQSASDHFAVSLSASAIRYATAGNFPVAVIMSRDRKVAWSAISELFPYQFLRKGYLVNKHSEAEAFFAGQEVDREPHTVLADSWFLEDRNFRRDHMLIEQCLPMPAYNSVLTLVWEE